MIVYTARITPQERQALTELASSLRRVARHKVTKELAATLEQWATAHVPRELDTAALDGWKQRQAAAWEQLSASGLKTYCAEFHAARECAFAARGAGMRAPQSFSDNVADATRALSAAQQ